MDAATRNPQPRPLERTESPPGALRRLLCARPDPPQPSTSLRPPMTTTRLTRTGCSKPWRARRNPPSHRHRPS